MKGNLIFILWLYIVYSIRLSLAGWLVIFLSSWLWRSQSPYCEVAYEEDLRQGSVVSVMSGRDLYPRARKKLGPSVSRKWILLTTSVSFDVDLLQVILIYFLMRTEPWQMLLLRTQLRHVRTLDLWKQR